MTEYAVTLETQIAELKRELAVREHVYAAWLTKGKMRQEDADKQMARMRGDGLRPFPREPTTHRPYR